MGDAIHVYPLLGYPWVPPMDWKPPNLHIHLWSVHRRRVSDQKERPGVLSFTVAMTAETGKQKAAVGAKWPACPEVLNSWPVCSLGSKHGLLQSYFKLNVGYTCLHFPPGQWWEGVGGLSGNFTVGLVSWVWERIIYTCLQTENRQILAESMKHLDFMILWYIMFIPSLMELILLMFFSPMHLLLFHR